ncbi:hypothetical protein R6Q59_035927 [Mikania micrantha]
MEGWYFVKHKSSLMLLCMFLVFMVGWAHQGISIEEDERKALLAIKASLIEVSESFTNILPSWVIVDGSNYCDWERINCNTTSPSGGNTYVTDLSLGDIFSMKDNDFKELMWPLNFSVFLHFKELRKLDLSWNFIGNTFHGFENLSELKKLENLNLSCNFIKTNKIFLSLSQLTSLKVLDLSYINGYQEHQLDISKFPENMEVLNLTGCGFYGTLQMQGSETTSTLKKLKILNLGHNQFNESLLSSISALASLKSLDLSANLLSGSFPYQDCKSLRRLEKLESLSLSRNNFNKNIISCLSFLPSLNTLDLSRSFEFGTSSFPMQELASLRGLKSLDMSWCQLQSLTFNGTMSKLTHLNLDYNNFFSVDEVMRSIATTFPSLRFISLSGSFIGGRLFANEEPNFPYLKVFILSHNNFNGTLPIKALASFHRLEVLDLSYNNFIGSIPSTINLLSSLKVVSLARNLFNGSLTNNALACFHHLETLDLSGNNFIGSIPSIINSLSSLKAISFASNAFNGSLTNNEFCKLKNIHELDLSDNMFDGNLPECFNRLSSLQFFDISSNQFRGVLMPLITNLTSLEYVDFSGNKFEGLFLLSWFSNHTKLEFVAFSGDNENFEVETEEPIGWTCMFQLKVLILQSCNLNRHKGSVIPSFLLHQHKLIQLDMSCNSLEGQFPDWLIKNNTMLQFLNLHDNLFGGTLSTSFYRTNTWWLDVSGNQMIGTIPNDIQKSFPFIYHLNLSRNSIEGVIPSSIGDLSMLGELDLSHNRFSGEVPIGLLTSHPELRLLVLSNNSLYGEVLSRDFNFINICVLLLDNNFFTGKVGNVSDLSQLIILDISNNFFTGLIHDDINNISTLPPNLWFLDLSKNYFSGPIPFSLNNFQDTRHILFGYQQIYRIIPNSFRNLTKVLTLDIGKHYLSAGSKFIGELSFKDLLLGKK